MGIFKSVYRLVFDQRKLQEDWKTIFMDLVGAYFLIIACLEQSKDEALMREEPKILWALATMLMVMVTLERASAMNALTGMASAVELSPSNQAKVQGLCNAASLKDWSIADIVRAKRHLDKLWPGAVDSIFGNYDTDFVPAYVRSLNLLSPFRKP